MSADKWGPRQGIKEEYRGAKDTGDKADPHELKTRGTVSKSKVHLNLGKVKIKNK